MQGSAFKIGKTNHAGIKVILKRTVPSVYNDTIYTDATGHYSKVVPTGIYNIKFYKDSFPFPTDYQYQRTCYSNQTLNNVNLYPINGIVPAGNYFIGNSASININDTLRLLPGVIMSFFDNSSITINNGCLYAEGNISDSIVLKKYPNSTWQGLTIYGQKISYLDFVSIKDAPVGLSSYSINKCSLYAKNCTFYGSVYQNYHYYGGFLDFTRCKFIQSIVVNTSGFSCQGCILPLYIRESRILNGINTGGTTGGNNVVIIHNSIITGNRIVCREMYNCIVYDVDNQSTLFISMSVLPKIYNTIFYSNNNTKIIDKENWTVQNCCFYDNGIVYNGSNSYFGDYIATNNNGDSIDIYGNIFVDPMLADTANNNFHLVTGSPCIDVGDNLSVVDTIDFDGNWRVADGNGDSQYIVDIGPYEYNSPFYEVHNLGVTEWNHPLSACNLGSEQVTIRVRNYGTMPETGFTLSYSLNNGITWHNEVYSGTLAPGYTMTYNFTTPANFSTNGTYQCYAKVHLTGDSQASNDSLFHSVSKQSTLLVTAQQYQAINCYGGTGSVVAHATGGNIPYSFLWNNTPSSADSIANGIYAGIITNITVTDNLGCTGNASITLTQPDLLQIDITAHAANCNQLNGWAEALVTGGMAPYYFLWSNGDTLYTADTLASGTYSLQVTDDNGCAKTVYFAINNTGGFTLTGSAQSAHCYNGSDGAIDLTVSGGTAPYIYEWSNGATTQDINGLVAGTYDVFVTDGIGCMGTTSFEVQNGSEITFTSSNTNPSCSQNNGSIILTPNGGNSPYTYHWSGGQTSNTLSGVGAGNYIVTIYDANMCVKIAQISLNNTNAPIVNISSVQSAPCGGGGAAYISVTGGTTPYTYHWSNSYFGQNLVGFAPGQYVVTVTEQTGCVAVTQIEIPVEALPFQPICVVTVDSLISRNKIVWEKVSLTGVDYYKIYRESSVPNQYLLVDTVKYASMSEFVDPAANPFIRSWRYKISQVDMCGNESPLSDLHKTIHLTINQGAGNSRNLIWDDYEGYSYSTFYIHRHTNALGWVIIDSLPNTLHSYTDVPPSQGGLKYIVSTKVPSPCMPTSISKAQGGPYSHAHSNMEDVAIVLNIKDNVTTNEIEIYPNPFSEYTNISFTNSGLTITKAKLLIIDITGKIVRTYILSENQLLGNKIVIERKDLNAGIYFVELRSDRVYRGKLVVE